MKLLSNVVNNERLTDLYIQVLDDLANSLERSFGPSGSNTLIQVGEDTAPFYTKDGHTILKHIKYHNIIEKTIADNVLGITRYIANTVGDGTTSAVLMSAKILRGIIEYGKDHKDISPAGIIKAFDKVVKEITDAIEKNGREFTIDDAYTISMISTNGNEEISKEVYQIYKALGKDVFISLNIAHNVEDVTNIYDGLVLDTGLIEEAYVNDPINKICRIQNPKIYAFQDAIDTPEMAGFLDTIIKKNIVDALNANDSNAFVPTVIIAPKLSRDCSSMLQGVVEMMSRVNGADVKYRPPLLIVTNVESVDMGTYNDICQMCNCRMIKKYIDPRLQETDIKNGKAPTLDTICEFAGTAATVESDHFKTSFIQPALMVEKVEVTKEDGTKTTEVQPTETYKSLVAFLETEIKKSRDEGEDYVTIGQLQRRLNSLKASFVEWFVGGVSSADRDARKASIEDAIKNCRSAAKDGVGYGANFEGLRAALDALDKPHHAVEGDFISIIATAYKEVTTKLYSSVYGADEATEMTKKSYENGKPFNLRGGDEEVLSSIKSDIMILESINKIITIMATSNQYICPDVVHTAPYRVEEEKYEAEQKVKALAESKN